LGAVVLVALNLRAVITSVPPLAVELAAELHLGAVAIGALTTVPVACMGLFAPIAVVATRWTSQSTVLGAGLALIALGGAVRGVGGVAGLFVATAVAGVGIAVVGTLLPGLVRGRSPARVGPVTGLYTAALISGAMIASAAAEPIRAWLGTSAQSALAAWAVPAVVALAAWIVVARRGRPVRRAMANGEARPSAAGRSGAGRLPWRDGSAWLGTTFMGTQSLLFYGSLAWLAPSAMEHGLTTHDAGLLLGLFSATQVVTAILVPALAHRTGDARPWIVASVGTTTVGLLLVALAPGAFPAAPWVWAAVLGLGMGSTMSLALSTVTNLAPSSSTTPAYTGMAFLVGYTIAAIGPVLLGFLFDTAGGFRLPFLVLAVLGPVTMILGVLAATRARARQGR
jgi:CP family cyanate transporter-like MFS transporter